MSEAARMACMPYAAPMPQSFITACLWLHAVEPSAAWRWLQGPAGPCGMRPRARSAPCCVFAPPLLLLAASPYLTLLHLPSTPVKLSCGTAIRSCAGFTQQVTACKVMAADLGLDLPGCLGPEGRILP